MISFKYRLLSFLIASTSITGLAANSGYSAFAPDPSFDNYALSCRDATGQALTVGGDGYILYVRTKDGHSARIFNAFGDVSPSNTYIFTSFMVRYNVKTPFRELGGGLKYTIQYNRSRTQARVQVNANVPNPYTPGLSVDQAISMTCKVNG